MHLCCVSLTSGTLRARYSSSSSGSGPSASALYAPLVASAAAAIAWSRGSTVEDEKEHLPSLISWHSLSTRATAAAGWLLPARALADHQQSARSDRSNISDKMMAASVAERQSQSLRSQLLADPSAVVALALTAPCAALLRGDAAPPDTVAALCDALSLHLSRRGALAAWEVTSAAWGLACMGAEPSPELLGQLVAALDSGCRGGGMPPQDIVMQASVSVQQNFGLHAESFYCYEIAH